MSFPPHFQRGDRTVNAVGKSGKKEYIIALSASMRVRGEIAYALWNGKA
jgi:hypothetical protein